MTKLLDEAVEVLRGLPEDEQEKAARAVIDYGARDDELQLTDEQVAKIERRMAKQHGFDIRDLLDERRTSKGSAAPKYRDPKTPENVWTGRGRIPRWMAATTKGGKASKDDFLI